MSELSVARDYEELLASRDGAIANHRLMVNSTITHSLARISDLLRKTVRASNGETEQSEEPQMPKDTARGYRPTSREPKNDFALERECELARLEKENEELRRLLGFGTGESNEDSVERQIAASRNPQRRVGSLMVGQSSTSGFMPQGMGIGPPRNHGGYGDQEMWNHRPPYSM
jgi:hypothetical protein